MKTRLTACFLLTCMTSCTYEGIDKRDSQVSREVHYNQKTGEQVAERKYKYDGSRNLVSEVFTSTLSPETNVDITYKYDSDNRLVLKKERYTENGDRLYTTEYAYENGLIKSESNYSEADEWGYRTLYFYTGTLIDSTQNFSYSRVDQRQNDPFTYLYHYDDQQHLVRKNPSKFHGETIYKYDSDLLTTTCDYGDIYGLLRERCFDNEYNSAGQITKIFESTEWEVPEVEHRLYEERFYDGDRLDEKRTYQYYMDRLEKVVSVTRIKYEYLD